MLVMVRVATSGWHVNIAMVALKGPAVLVPFAPAALGGEARVRGTLGQAQAVQAKLLFAWAPQKNAREVW